MSELHPCPECHRHIRKTETACPFCGESVSLAHLPAHPTPGRRLGRAATFAFGASVVGATAVVACGQDVAVYGAPSPPSTAGVGGTSADGSGGEGGRPDDGSAGSPLYGAPPAGESAGGNASGGTGGAAGTSSDAGAPGGGAGGEGAATAIYGGPPAGAGGQ